MVNFVELQKPLLHGLMKLSGLTPHTVEIEQGTCMSFWLPSETKKPPPKTPTTKKKKPVVVLIHGFAAEGIVTWQFQIGALTGTYAVYVPDLLFFGGSVTSSSDRSPAFQAQCLIKALVKLGVEKCSLVGFSYGGMVAFKMAEMVPEMVESLVISGSVLAMTDSISETTLQRLGFESSADLLLPSSVEGLKALLSVACHKKLWFPNRLYKDFLKVMFNNRREREELLQGLVISNKDTFIPHFRQKILLLWGENDQIFNLDHAKKMMEQMGGNNTRMQVIEKAGHLVQLERPCMYNKHLKEYLAHSILHTKTQ